MDQKQQSQKNSSNKMANKIHCEFFHRSTLYQKIQNISNEAKYWKHNYVDEDRKN